MIRIGLISMAHMHAYSYARALLTMDERARIAGVFDPDPERGQKAAEQFGSQYFGDLQELLSKADAVIICSENSLHMEYTLAAAAAGCHVLCEKPIATNEEDALRMIAACDQAGVKLQIAFPVRFAAPMQRAKELLDANAIGDILCIKGTNHGQMPGGWFVDQELSGGGAVMDHTVHVVDLIRWFLGKEVVSMYAEVDTMLYDVDIDDCGMLSMELEGGIFATQDPSWSRPRTFPTWGDVLLDIVGTEGILRVDAFAQGLTVFDDQERQVVQHSWAEDMDMLLIADFLHSIETDAPPSVSGYDGLQAMRAALAAYESARQQKVVSVAK